MIGELKLTEEEIKYLEEPCVESENACVVKAYLSADTSLAPFVATLERVLM